MKCSRAILVSALCGLLFSLALPPPAFDIQAAPLSAVPLQFSPTAPDSVLAVFDPITHTVLPAGNYAYDAFTIRDGIVVTFTGAVSVSVADDLDIAGKLVGDCFSLALHVQGGITLTGTVDNVCSAPSDAPGDITIYSYGGSIAVGTVEAAAELRSSGNIYVSNAPALPDWEFDVLPTERSATPLAPVCAAEADTLLGTVWVSPTLGAEVAFYGEGADPDGGPVTYAWDMGDGGVSEEQSPVYTYTAWGVYDVLLTVTDDEGDTCRATLRVVLDDGEAHFPDEPAVDAGPAALVVAAGQESYFYAAALDPQWDEVAYRWDLGDGGTSTETNPVYAYAAPGRYEVVLVVTDTAGFTSTARAAVYVFSSFTTFLPLVLRSGAAGLRAGVTPALVDCLTPGPGFFNLVNNVPQAAPGRKGGDLIYRGRGDIVLGGGTDIRAGQGGDGVSRVGSGTVRGGNGGPGGSLQLLVAGRLTICGGAYLASGDGGAGGSATSNTPPPGTARALGGKGGAAGALLNVKATGGVTFDSPFGNPVVVSPGDGGAGGWAEAFGGTGAAGGCQGQPGARAEAVGGAGGKASKLGRGSATGLANLEVQGGRGGFGGGATALGGDGGAANCAGVAVGGAGRPAKATGGLGGRAQYAGAFRGNLSPTAFTAGDGGNAWAIGGFGGAATATALPAVCGAATATGGEGSLGESYGGKGGAGRIHGNGGDADAFGGDGGAADATGGDCLPCLAGGGGSATGGRGGDALAKYGLRGGRTAADGVATSIGGTGGAASATGGAGGDCADCPAGAGGAGGPALAVGGDGGDAFGNGALAGGNGGDADALGGPGGEGATCCNPPQVGGDGGRGGDATSLAGSPGNPPGNWGANGIQGGDGGDGGDGEPTAGAGGAPGVGMGWPVNIPDGLPGQPGGDCPCMPPNHGRIDWQPLEPTVGGVVTFTGSASGTLPMTFTWDFGDGAQGQGNPIKHIYEMPGEYEVEMVAMNLCGSTVVTAVVVVRSCIPPHDTAFTWTPAEPIMGEPVTFVGYSTGTLPIEYFWNFGDGMTGTGEMVVHIFEMPAEYEVTLVAHNACGMDIYAALVAVSPPPRMGRRMAPFAPVAYLPLARLEN